MSRIYSHKLLSGILLSGPLVYTNSVPGQVVVVRSMSAYNTLANGDRVAELIVNIGACLGAWSSPFGKSVAGESYEWEGRQCLETGDQLHVGSGSEWWEFIASGYILSP